MIGRVLPAGRDITAKIRGRYSAASLLLERQVVASSSTIDQPQACAAGKDRRAGTDDNAGFAIARGDPGVQALAVIQPGMQNHTGNTETPF